MFIKVQKSFLKSFSLIELINNIIFIKKRFLEFCLWKILNFEVFEDILIWISRRECVLQTCTILYHRVVIWRVKASPTEYREI